MPPPAPPGLFARVLARVRRASELVRRGLVLALLALVYALVLPWFALALRLRPRPGGFRVRRDPELATRARLRAPF